MTITGTPIRDALREGVQQLLSANVPDAEADAGWLLEHVTGFPRMLLAINREPLTAEQAARYSDLLGERARRTPVQYLLGEVQFAGVTIKVEPGVLIPRPETELLYKRSEAFLKNMLGKPDLLKTQNTPKSMRRSGRLRILDLCSGSGALAIALGKRFPKADVFGLDIDEEACSQMVSNARLNGVHTACFQSDLLEQFNSITFFNGFFHAIVCNPPYIPSGEIPSLQPEVLCEPLIALDGGADGLDFYRRIAADAPRLIDPNGALFLEIGKGQADAVRGMMQPHFETIYVESDWNDIPRVVSAINPKGE
jgi:release factor glutamine methyltransferase